MTLIRMLWDMQGSRYDGQPWPGYLKEIDVPEWEAGGMVSAGTAEYADAPIRDRGFNVLKDPDPHFEEHLKLADGTDPEEEEVRGNREPAVAGAADDDDFDSDFDCDDSDNEVEEVTTQVKRPSTIDNKAAWIEWAVSKGADREKASAKTKAMLIAEY